MITKTKRHTEQGFSAVELLITLFVAAAFLATGYQLYYTAIESGGQARLRAVANNIAYDKLRFYAAKATKPCTTKSTTALNPTLPTNHGLGNASITAWIECPYSSSSPDISKIIVVITYGAQTNNEKTRHVIYTTPNL